MKDVLASAVFYLNSCDLVVGPVQGNQRALGDMLMLKKTEVIS